MEKIDFEFLLNFLSFSVKNEAIKFYSIIPWSLLVIQDRLGKRLLANVSAIFGPKSGHCLLSYRTSYYFLIIALVSILAI